MITVYKNTINKLPKPQKYFQKKCEI